VVESGKPENFPEYAPFVCRIKCGSNKKIMKTSIDKALKPLILHAPKLCVCVCVCVCVVLFCNYCACPKPRISVKGIRGKSQKTP
jgi:hypothetical protein